MANDKLAAWLHVFYRWAVRLIGVLPPWLLRLRPFGVYEISIPGAQGERKTASASATEVRWISSVEEAARLASVTNAKNIAEWNGVSRRAVAAWRGDEIIAVAWIASESFGESELGVKFDLKPEEVWLFASVVSPAFRRQGVYRQMLGFLVDEFRSTKVKRILLGISIGNRPSLEAHTQQDASQIGTIFALKSLGLVLCRCSGHVRRISLSPISWCRPVRLVVYFG